MDDMLVDGMTIAVRYRRDFVVTDAERLLAAARQLYRDRHPGATDAEERVTSVADVVYTVLEHAGLIADSVEDRLATPGLDLRGWRSEVTVDEPAPLRRDWDCLRDDDVFALPAPRGQ